jgi:L-malate glycosyltransferase
MKILFLTPKYFPTLSGNTITVDRIKRKLEKKGMDVTVATSASVSKALINKEKPDIVHAFHARKSNIGNIRKYLKEKQIPYIITLTGTDANIEIKERKQRHEMKKSIEDASYITAFQRSMLTKITERKITIKKKKVIPQGPPIFKKITFNFKKYFSLQREDYVILLVAGIRDIKDPLYAIKEVDSVVKNNDCVKLVILGEIVDKKYDIKLKQYCKENNCTFIKQGKIPHDAMPYAYKASNLIINTSSSESMSTALVEAQYFGKQILATDIPGNSFLPKSCLYKKKKGELAKAIEKRMKRIKRIRRRTKRTTKDSEADVYIRLYKQIL